MQTPTARNTSAQQTGAGQGLARAEDARLLQGQGLYVHDVVLPGMLHAVFVRSMYACATDLIVDVSAALAGRGVRAVFTAQDLGDIRLPEPNPLLPIQHAPPMALLADGRIEFVGQAVAMVVAESLQEALRAAEQVSVDCQSVAAQTDHTEDSGAFPPSSEAVFRQGEKPPTSGLRVDMQHRQPRVVALALEPRATVARWTPGEGLVAWMGTQAPTRARNDIARAMNLRVDQVRVIAPDVGGAFGAKSSVTPEDLLIAWAARRIAAPIKWTATRSEEFTGGMHGRGAQLRGSLWFDAHGEFQHLQADMQFPLGAWLPYSAVVPSRNAARILPGPYVVKGLDIVARTQRSNAAAVTIYRGAGRPEAALLMETLVERAARLLNMDPVELRLRNLIPATAMPWKTPTGETLDAGDYAQALRRACERFDYAAERAQQLQRRAAGEVVGIGTALYIEPCGQGWESARVTLTSDGRAVVASGSSAQGQGHQTSYASIAAEALGMDAARIEVQHGDTATCPEGIGALASRSMAIGGSAVLLAAQEAAQLRDAGRALPIVVDKIFHSGGEAWSYGCVMVRMAIDADTGQPALERVLWVDDAGHIVSPQLAVGQLLGGLAQGMGQALMERMVYDEDGQLLTGSLMDYAIPRAADMPPVELESLHIPSTVNPLGAKGVGEAGCIGVPAAVLNAAADALTPWGEVALDFPLTSERLWRAMQASY